MTFVVGTASTSRALAAATHRTSVGDVTLIVGPSGLTNCSFAPAPVLCRRWGASTGTPSDPALAAFLALARAELDRYLDGGSQPFTVPVDLRHVADFDRSVLQALRHVPYGETVTYGGLAGRLGLPASAARAVGRALAANPVLIVVPCHRVIGAQGSLVGYAGGLDVKRRLLDLEAVQAGHALRLF